MKNNKENLTPYVLEIVEERRHKVVVYGTDFDDAMCITKRLRDNGTISMDGKLAHQHIMLLGQASEEDMSTYSDIFDRNSEVSLPSESDQLERAKGLIQMFCVSEYQECDEDFSDLENIGLAYTDLEESNHGSYKITVTADLIHFMIRTFINDILVSTVKCDSLKEMCDEQLEYLDYDDLVFITDEEWKTFCNTVAKNNERRVDELRAEYPKGTRIRLIKMCADPQPIEVGSTGTVDLVDDAGQLHVNWRCHRSLALIPGADLFEVLSIPFLCNKDWYLDGKLICGAGKEYTFIPAPEEGYCDIICCEGGNITMTSFLEAGEYFDGL